MAWKRGRSRSNWCLTMQSSGLKQIKPPNRHNAGIWSNRSLFHSQHRSWTVRLREKWTLVQNHVHRSHARSKILFEDLAGKHWETKNSLETMDNMDMYFSKCFIMFAMQQMIGQRNSSGMLPSSSGFLEADG